MIVNLTLDGELRAHLKNLRQEVFENFHRHVSINDLLSDRWETAKFYGFGEETSCYNEVLIIGDVKVGHHTWIGPNVVLDGTGGLSIGDFVSISAGVQIYTHHTVKWANSRGKEPIDCMLTTIGNGVYIGPNSVLQMGITIGDDAVIGAMSFVNHDVPAGAHYAGVPAKELLSRDAR